MSKSMKSTKSLTDENLSAKKPTKLSETIESIDDKDVPFVSLVKAKSLNKK